MSSEVPLYKFVKGSGDLAHEQAIEQLTQNGYRVATMMLDPDGRGNNQTVVVLMSRNP